MFPYEIIVDTFKYIKNINENSFGLMYALHHITKKLEI